jgi:dephospho-CoA kinase
LRRPAQHVLGHVALNPACHPERSPGGAVSKKPFRHGVDILRAGDPSIPVPRTSAQDDRYPGSPAHREHGPETGRRPRKFVLGVTGNIASGKSTVVRRLEENGAIGIDADLVYRELVGPGQPLLRSLADRFGEGIIAPDGSLDRPALGAIVFSDPAKLAELDALTHPAVIAEVDRRVASIDDGVVVIDAVKLIESGHADHCDEVWVVTIDTDAQMTRLMKRNTLPALEARRRVEAQPPMAPKLARADRVIDNSGTLEETHAQVDAGWRKIMCRMGEGAD